MNKHGVFITGTDTGVGKTAIAVGLLQALRNRGVLAAGLKPVATGCVATSEGLRNEDAELLRCYGGINLPYNLLNPLSFLPSIAPHLAAREAGVAISWPVIDQAHQQVRAQVEALVVEGVGGWRVPLGADWTVADLARRLGYPVLLVVGLRLGCISHSLLSLEAIRRDGLPVLGWVANAIDADYSHQDETIDTIENLSGAACLAHVPRAAQLDQDEFVASLKPVAASLLDDSPH